MARKWIFLLISSIAINLMLIGAVIGHTTHRLRPPPIAIEGPASAKEEIKNFRRNTKGLKKEIHQLRQDIFQTLTAEKFDGSRYQQQINQLHQLRGELHQKMANMVKKLGSELSQEERKKLAKQLRHHRRPPPRAK